MLLCRTCACSCGAQCEERPLDFCLIKASFQPKHHEAACHIREAPRITSYHTVGKAGVVGTWDKKLMRSACPTRIDEAMATAPSCCTRTLCAPASLRLRAGSARTSHPRRVPIASACLRPLGEGACTRRCSCLMRGSLWSLDANDYCSLPGRKTTPRQVPNPTAPHSQRSSVALLGSPWRPRKTKVLCHDIASWRPRKTKSREGDGRERMRQVVYAAG